MWHFQYAADSVMLTESKGATGVLGALRSLRFLRIGRIGSAWVCLAMLYSNFKSKVYFVQKADR